MHKRKDILALLKELRAVQLTEVERAQIRASLEKKAGVLSNEPAVILGSADRLHIHEGRIPSPISRFTLIYSQKSMTGIAVALILALSGGGTVYAAENALPGDALYSVKTEVNETVRGWMAVSAESKAAWEARLAQRRLNEAVELSAEGRLEGDVRSDLQERTQHNESVLQERIADLRAKGNAEAATKIEAALNNIVQVRQEVFTRVEANTQIDESVRAQLRGAVDSLDATVGEIRGVRVRVDGSANADVRSDANADMRADMEDNDEKMEDPESDDDSRSGGSIRVDTGIRAGAGQDDTSTDAEMRAKGELEVSL